MNRFISAVLFLVVAFGGFAKAPKYVFYFIGDGMGIGSVAAADMYYRTVLGHDQNLTMLQFPVVSVATTNSYDNPITDSAASGTALSTGTKTRNGMIGMGPDSVAATSIATQLKKEGYGIGIASSVFLNDATPSAFYAHQVSRRMAYEICVDLSNSNYEIFAGPALQGWKNKDGKERQEK